MASSTCSATSCLLLLAVLLHGCTAQVREAAPRAPGASLGPPTPTPTPQCYKWTDQLPSTLTTVCVNGVASRVEATGDVRVVGRDFASQGGGQMTWTGGDPCDTDPSQKYSISATVLCGDSSQGGYVQRSGCAYQMKIYDRSACGTPSPPTPSPVVPSPVRPSPVRPSPVLPSPVLPSPVLPSPAVVPSPVLRPRKHPRHPAPAVVPPPLTVPVPPVPTPTVTDTPAVATPQASTVDGQTVGAAVPRSADPAGLSAPVDPPKKENKDKRKLTKDGAVLAGIIIGPALILGTMLCWGMLFAWRWYKDREEPDQALTDPFSTIDNPIAGHKADPSASATPPPAPRLPSSSHWV